MVDADVGVFNTQDVKQWDDTKTKKTPAVPKKFVPAYAHAPQVAVALNSMDIDKNKNVRISAEVTNINSEGLMCNVTSWADTTMYSGGMTYLHSGPRRGWLQTGVFSLSELKTPIQEMNTQVIQFPKRYYSKPNVVCFIKMLDFAWDENVRCEVGVSSVNQSEFTAFIRTWDRSKMYNAALTWIAYPSTEASMASGTFDTTSIKDRPKTTNVNSGRVAFPKTFSKAPTVMIGLRALDYDWRHNVRFSCSASSVTATDFFANMQGWDDSKMYASGISYLAFVDP